jgi:hypothetical protein
MVAEDENELMALTAGPQPVKTAAGVGRFIQLTDMHFDAQYQVSSTLSPQLDGVP